MMNIDMVAVGVIASVVGCVVVLAVIGYRVIKQIEGNDNSDS